MADATMDKQSDAPLFIILISMLTATGCVSLGARTAQVDQVSYAVSLSEAQKEQLPSNIVRMRHGEPASFVSLGQTVQGYSRRVGAEAGVDFGLVGDETPTLGGNLTDEDRPTLTLTPIQSVPVPPQITVRDDHGGQIIVYALQMKRMEQAGSNVRFAGRCISACTLYLALPRSRTCITRGASFGFHLPYGASARVNKVAHDYLVRNYPDWVRAWIARNGGLTNRINTMNYAYAAKYLPVCNTPGFTVRNDPDFSIAGSSAI